MRSPQRRFRSGALLPLLLLVLPAVASAQVPAFLSMWGSYGTGPGQFLTPVGVALDATGRVYVLDSNNPRIQVFSHEGAYLSQWALTGAGSRGEPAIVIDSRDVVYVADPVTSAVRTYTLQGSPLSVIGTPGTGPGQLKSPYGLAIAPNGDVFISTYTPPRVQRFTRDGQYLLEWPIQVLPDGLACDASGNVYVADNYGYRILKYTGTGEYLGQWGSYGSGPGQFLFPVRIAIGTDGIVYVDDFGNQRIAMFTPDGALLGQWGTPGTGIGQFDHPIGIATAPDGSVYVCDTNNSRVQRFGPAATAVEAQSWGAVKARYR